MNASTDGYFYRSLWPCHTECSATAVAQDTQGFPRVERDLRQVEQYSQELKVKAARIDPAGDALAATRLLAQEGLSTRKCGGFSSSSPDAPGR